MFIETTIKVLLYILIILLGYALANIYAIQYVKLNDWGVWANWVIALCNIFMAGAAGVAAFTARQWFYQKAQLNTLDAAHKLAFDFENNLWEINDRLYADILLRRNLENEIKQKTTSQDEIKKLIVSEIDKKTSTDLSELAYLCSRINKLRRHNVFIHPTFMKIFNDVIHLRKDYLDNHYIYLALLATNQDNLDDSDLIAKKELLNKSKKNLANIFENELTKLDINKDYDFRNFK
ncbi:hypothetical protein D3C81_840810 [compost metagenome]